MQMQGRKHTHACPHTTPTGPRACGGELTVPTWYHTCMRLFVCGMACGGLWYSEFHIVVWSEGFPHVQLLLTFRKLFITFPRIHDLLRVRWLASQQRLQTLFGSLSVDDMASSEHFVQVSNKNVQAAVTWRSKCV